MKNRAELITQRIERQKIADQKWKKTKRIIRLIQIIPYMRMALASGSMAINNPKKESDIDLLIVTQHNRIWTCRALLTLFFHVLGKRRHGQLTQDRFCLNHYLTNQSLKIPCQSIYNAQTYAHLVPLWKIHPCIYQQFQKDNQWIKNYLNFYPQEQIGYQQTIKQNTILNLFRKIPEMMLDNIAGDGLENILRKIQTKRIKKDKLTYKSGGRIIFNDQQLEFHPDSPEKRIIEQYNAKLINLGLPELAKENDSGLIL